MEAQIQSTEALEDGHGNITSLETQPQSRFRLSKNPVLHERSKHIAVLYHFIRNCVETGQVEVEHVRTENQHAYILTKPL
jgi:hypothetical protein